MSVSSTSDQAISRPDASATTHSGDQQEFGENLPGNSRGRASGRSRLRKFLSFRNISALYILVAELVIFSILLPDTFMRPETFTNIAGEQAITVIIAVGLLFPFVSGAFDLAVGMEVGLGAVLVAFLLANAQLPIPVAILFTLGAGALIGLFNGFLVVKGRIDSFIATLGVSSILTAAVMWISGGSQILGLQLEFQNIGNEKFLGIVLPFFVMLAVAAVVWYFLEVTPSGRKVYATGGNLEAARMAGVGTAGIIILSFVICGVTATGAGVLISAQIGAGDPTLGPSYLLPCITAVFLGSTQFRNGRFNVLGTVVAVYVLALGVKGLQLAGAPVWIPDLFNGAALLLAVGMAKWQRPGGGPSDIWKLLGRFRRRRAAVVSKVAGS